LRFPEETLDDGGTCHACDFEMKPVECAERPRLSLPCSGVAGCLLLLSIVPIQKKKKEVLRHATIFPVQ